jgi:hypothetical protein
LVGKLPDMRNGHRDRRATALLRSEACALERLARLRGELIDVLAIVDRANAACYGNAASGRR